MVGSLVDKEPGVTGAAKESIEAFGIGFPNGSVLPGRIGNEMMERLVIGVGGSIAHALDIGTLGLEESMSIVDGPTDETMVTSPENARKRLKPIVKEKKEPVGLRPIDILVSPWLKFATRKGDFLQWHPGVRGMP